MHLTRYWMRMPRTEGPNVIENQTNTWGRGERAKKEDARDEGRKKRRKIESHHMRNTVTWIIDQDFCHSNQEMRKFNLTPATTAENERRDRWEVKSIKRRIKCTNAPINGPLDQWQIEKLTSFKDKVTFTPRLHLMVAFIDVVLSFSQLLHSSLLR